MSLPSDDDYFATSITLIEERLALDGGIRRYPTDVYFGSGAWPVLTGSFGLALRRFGRSRERRTMSSLDCQSLR